MGNACRGVCECPEDGGNAIEKIPELPSTSEQVADISDNTLLETPFRVRVSQDNGRLSKFSDTCELATEPTHETTPRRSSKVEAGRISCQSVPDSKQLEATTEGCASPAATELPTPADLIKQVLEPSQIFNAGSHEICAFGFTQSSHKGKALVEDEYSEKKLVFSGADTDDKLRTALAKVGIGMCCKKARKHGTPNQDNLFVCRKGAFTLCGVADGHGPDGHWCSHWIVRYVLKLLLAELEISSMLPGDQVVKHVFGLTHEALEAHSKTKKSEFDSQCSGSTLSVCIIDHSKKVSVVAWAGDSRCSWGKMQGKSSADLTYDHKPDQEEEKMRIEAAGGEVSNEGEDSPYRVYMKGQPIPGLAMSRALGDTYAQTIGVTYAPDILRYRVDDCFLLCCSDGVWEFIDSAEAAVTVGERGRDDVRYAVELLTRNARSRWIEEEGDTTDDISAICVYV